MVNALMDCNVDSGTCEIVSTDFYNQTHQGQTIENVSVNVTINGTGASPTGWCNVSCVIGKSYGNYTNVTNASIMHNITWCNAGIKQYNKSQILIYIVNQTSLTNECNITFAVKASNWSTNNATIYINSIQLRASEPGYPLVYVGASALAGATIAFIWWNRRRS